MSISGSGRSDHCGEFIAHRRKSGECQGLADHLVEVSGLAGAHAAKLGLGAAGELVGLLHDLGKYSREFQRYLKSAVGLLEQDKDEDYVDASSKKGKIDHSSAGAQVLWQQFSQRGRAEQVLGQVLALCIASHHSGLIDCVEIDGTDRFSTRMNKSNDLSHRLQSWDKADERVRERYLHLVNDTDLAPAFRTFIRSICEGAESEQIVRFKVGLLVRYMFSSLVDADRSNSADFERLGKLGRQTPASRPDWPTMLQRLEGALAGLDCRNRIDEVRNAVSDDCWRAGQREKGIFTLTVPTGGGKTLASLRFALHHARAHDLDRVIYVIPFTSIIDQNAKVARRILEPASAGVLPGSIVLEHHSNLSPEAENWRNKPLSENWSGPVIFTTMVQFLETLFGSGTRGARRMHNLARAVMIFDEVQTLPVNCVHLFNNAVNFLVEGCGSTAVLCTATQPLLQRVDEKKGAIRLAANSEIVPNMSAVFSDLKRVDVLDRRKPAGWTDEEVASLAVDEVNSSGSCLVIVNTKVAAQRLFQLFKNRAAGTHIYHLSASMCPAHRKNRLFHLCQLLHKEPTLCVSTQVIEAGIDLDFGSVIRFTAGLDSIAQAAGRCNRHGLRPPGRVYVVNPAEDKLEMLRDIRVGKEVAERVLDELPKDSKGSDVLCPSAIATYFQYYFFDRSDEMDYPVSPRDAGRDDTLLNMLAENRMAVEARDTPPAVYLRQSFMAAARAFKAIDSPTEGVIVPYSDAGKGVIGDLCSSAGIERQIALLKQAQQFSVNVFPQMLVRMKQARAVRETQEGTGILYVDPRFYHDDFGLTEAPSSPMEMLNV
jgi:CRISPR-associated endonuclease/helicase Cas3